MIRNACRVASGWPEDVAVAVNLSPVKFRNQGLALFIAGVRSETKLPPQLLEMEITEVLLLNNDSTRMILAQLQSLGVRIAMDDFGTGYSSLSYLRSVPFDKIKIDQSFVMDVVEKEESCAIVQAVTSFAGRLEMFTAAGGVETVAQMEKLKELGCNQIQGYVFSHPLTSLQLSAFLSAHSAQRIAA